MSEKITVPTLGESVTEATVSKWLKSQGDKVVADVLQQLFFGLTALKIFVTQRGQKVNNSALGPYRIVISQTKNVHNFPSDYNFGDV